MKKYFLIIFFVLLFTCVLDTDSVFAQKECECPVVCNTDEPDLFSVAFLCEDGEEDCPGTEYFSGMVDTVESIKEGCYYPDSDTLQEVITKMTFNWDGCTCDSEEVPPDQLEEENDTGMTGDEAVIKLCSGYTTGIHCASSPGECENVCNNESGGLCVFAGGVCQDASKVTLDEPKTPEINTWNKAEQTQYYQGMYAPPPGYAEAGGALPPCAFSGTCRNVNDLVQLIVNFGAGMFAIIGSFAFAFFVYGGFTIVTSFGNAERVKKGKDIMVAAVVGMIIAISAYLLVEVLLDALKVAPAFRGI